MKRAYFIAGTDTEVGKTVCTAALLAAFWAQGKTVFGWKPVASEADEQGQNPDVSALQTASGLALPYEAHNVYTFTEATAPHLAAADEGSAIEAEVLDAAFARAKTQAEIVLVEGAGGWHTPLNGCFCFSDWAAAQRLPVILVVGMKLGAINHALLTAQAVRQAGLPLAGWIANCMNGRPHRLDDYLATLQAFLQTPLLGVMPYLPEASAQERAVFLNIETLL
ncbi:MAG: dethiobiotin synthase [Neisseria sp.]|nr:dethiobiotin synthase [Neisseria sp.]